MEYVRQSVRSSVQRLPLTCDDNDEVDNWPRCAYFFLSFYFFCMWQFHFHHTFNLKQYSNIYMHHVTWPIIISSSKIKRKFIVSFFFWVKIWSANRFSAIYNKMKLVKWVTILQSTGMPDMIRPQYNYKKNCLFVFSSRSCYYCWISPLKITH